MTPKEELRSFKLKLRGMSPDARERVLASAEFGRLVVAAQAVEVGEVVGLVCIGHCHGHCHSHCAGCD